MPQILHFKTNAVNKQFTNIKNVKERVVKVCVVQTIEKTGMRKKTKLVAFKGKEKFFFNKENKKSVGF